METKNKQITLLQGKALLIELPEGAKMQGLQTTSPNAIVYADTHGHGVILDLPPGNWRIIGMLGEVREMDAIPLVDKERFIVDGPYLGFRNYKGNKYDWFGTAIESLESAIEGAGYYLDNNPIPPFHERKDDWLMAQERILDRSRCLLLGRGDLNIPFNHPAAEPPEAVDKFIKLMNRSDSGRGIYAAP